MTTNGSDASAIGSEVELEITNVAHGGVFIARHEGRVVFVSDTLPGERVRARLSDDRHARFWRAETLEVIEPSEHRQQHIWAAASIERDPDHRAGGAEFGHIDLAFQRELKRQIIADSLERMGKLPAAAADPDFRVEEPVGGETGDGAGWRTRIRLHVDEKGRPGPFAARSHRVVRVDDLPLATGAVENAAPLDERFPGVEAIDVVSSSDGVLVLAEKPRDRKSPRVPARTIRERVGEREFTLDARGFWQVHRQAPATLTAAVQTLVDDALFDPAAANLDLYGGVGLLAAALGDRFGPDVTITTVESSREATAHAVHNLADWSGASAITDRVERYVRKLASDASAFDRERLQAATVILDPPRAGAGREVITALAALDPAQLVYIACDPIAFARDVALLAGHGYRLAEYRAWDLFPHTHHVEAAGRFVR